MLFGFFLSRKRLLAALLYSPCSLTRFTTFIMLHLIEAVNVDVHHFTQERTSAGRINIGPGTEDEDMQRLLEKYPHPFEFAAGVSIPATQHPTPGAIPDGTKARRFTWPPMKTHLQIVTFEGYTHFGKE